MKKSQHQTSSLVFVLAGPAVLLCLYATHIQVNPAEAKSQIERLENEVEELTAAQIPTSKRIEAEDALKVEESKLAKVQAQLDERRQGAAQLMRGEVNGLEELKVAGEINRALKVAGLFLSDEQPMTGGRRSASMLRSLTDATEELSDVLKRMAESEEEDAPIEIPLDYAGELTPAEWIAAQRAVRTGSFDGPKTRSRELNLVGNYQSMVAGLEAVIDSCPGVVISSVAFEKPPVRSNDLIWKVQMQLRPTTERSRPTVDPEMSFAAGLTPFKSESSLMQNSASGGGSNSQLTPASLPSSNEQDETYTVSKPAIGTPE
ncbi:MAG: hypothetical protein AAGG48_16440 [Planctomycetota bacterium]